MGNVWHALEGMLLPRIGRKAGVNDIRIAFNLFEHLSVLILLCIVIVKASE